MRRLLIVLAVLVSSITPAMSQDMASDSQTLRDILAEIRQLRHELRVTTVDTERIQIALYRLQLQDAAVAKAAKLSEDAHSRLDSSIAGRKRIAATIEQWQNALQNGAPSESERTQMQRSLPSMKSNIEQLTSEEAKLQSRAAEADANLAREQRKLDDLNSVLDDLEYALQHAFGAAASKPGQ